MEARDGFLIGEFRENTACLFPIFQPNAECRTPIAGFPTAWEIWVRETSDSLPI
jgi:hypothetical protein